MEAYLSEVMGLQYEAQPDYQALKGGLTAALQLQGGGMQQPLHLQVRTEHWIILYWDATVTTTIMFCVLIF